MKIAYLLQGKDAGRGLQECRVGGGGRGGGGCRPGVAAEAIG